ncbi:MAG: FadR family transcriptional regulator [Paracoccaceae bacterium]|nr:FadR family transcriptional regulator [Paracoccaceae bacterium]
MLPKAEKVYGYDQVARILEGEIVAGRLKIGELLPTETDLAEALGVTRPTLREGLRALEVSGLIRRAGAKRLQVATPDPEQVAMTNARALGLTGANFNHLWEIQMELEPFAVGLAAERATEAETQKLFDLVAELAGTLSDDAAVIRHDIAFHGAISRAAANPALVLATAPVGQLLFSATLDLYRTVPAARHRLLQAHREIAAAVAARDGETARLWMQRHIRDFRRGYEIAGFDMNAPIELRRQHTG